MRNPNLIDTAVIRNSRLCSEFENIGHLVKFNKEFDVQGWTGSNITMLGASGSFLFLTSTGTSPNIYRGSKFGPVDADRYTQVYLRYKYTKKAVNSVATTGLLQFQTQADATWTEEKSLEFDVNPDGKWHQYRLNMGPVSTWVGIVNNLKIFLSTNGGAGDEIFVAEVRIESPIFEFCYTGCTDDINNTVVASFFDSTVIGNPPGGWTLLTSSTKKVFVNTDPEYDGSSNRVVELANLTSTSPGPSMLRGTSQLMKGYLSCKVRVGDTSGRIRLLRSISEDKSTAELSFNSDGFMKYRSASLDVDFDTAVGYETNKWYSILIHFDIALNSINFYIDGQLVGENKSLLFSGPVEGVRFENEGGSIHSIYVDEILIIEESEETLCPGMGRQGTLTSQPVEFTHLTIEKGVNDTFIADVDGYGDVVISLPAEENVTPQRMRLLLERAISSVDVGGYVYSEVDYVEGTFVIRSGTYDFDSSVSIKQHSSSTLSESLGFTENGVYVGNSKSGRPHASGFSFLNNFRAKTFDLTGLILDKEDSNPVIQNPSATTPIIGSIASGYSGRRSEVDGRGKTIIDFIHRANGDGNIKTLRFHGKLPTSIDTKGAGNNASVRGREIDVYVNQSTERVNFIRGDILALDEVGYSGNGEYSIKQIRKYSAGGPVTGTFKYTLVIDEELPRQENVDWYIHSIVKVRHYRQNKEGQLFLINELNLGQEDPTLLYTTDHVVYETDVNWAVRRGDYIGIYNATAIYTGDLELGEPEALYLEFEGDITPEESALHPPIGAGIKSIGLIGEGEFFQDRASYDIDFGQAISLEAFEVYGEEEEVLMNYNLAAAAGRGFSVGAEMHDPSHFHEPIRGSTGLAERIEHPNIPYNLAALTDNVLFTKNGLVGVHEQDDSRATYFYIDGDGEWADIEFPEPTWIAGTAEVLREYVDDPFSLTFSWTYPKDVHRIRLFFKEFANCDGYWVEFKELGSESVDFGAKHVGFRKIGGFSDPDVKYTTVRLDNKEYDYETVAERGKDHLQYSHFAKDYREYDQGPNMDIDEKHRYDATRLNPYYILDKEWETIQTTAVNFYCFHHESTKISEIQLFSSTSSLSDVQDLVEIYFSETGDFFQLANAVAVDGGVRFVIGHPVRFIRMVVAPMSEFSLDRVVPIVDSDLIRVRDYDLDKSIRSVDIESHKGEESSVKRISFVNKTGAEADFEITFVTNEMSDDVILKTSLNNLEEIEEPEIGPGGTVLQEEDFDFPVVSNVAINSECFGLLNLAANKPFYVSRDLQGESDFFTEFIDPVKWETFSNVPVPDRDYPVGNGYIVHEFPGLSLTPSRGSVSTGPEAGTTVETKLVSRWHPTGSFQATLAFDYDYRRWFVEPMVVRLGLIDATGRELYIQKRKYYYRDGSSTYDSAAYHIIDSLTGTLASKDAEQTISDGDYNRTYFVRIVRDLNPEAGLNLLKFYLKDDLSFTGNFEWTEYDSLNPNEETGYVINLDDLTTPLVGPFRLFIRTAWKNSADDDNGFGEGDNKVKISNFIFGGESTYATPPSSTITEHGTTSSLGLIDVNNYTSDITANPTTTVYLDLGRHYNLDGGLLRIVNTGMSGISLWTSDNISFSNSDVEDPLDVEISNTDLRNARWIIFQQANTAALGSIRTLHSVRAYPDITTRPDGLMTNSEWYPLGNILTDGLNTTAISQIDYPVVAVRLADVFKTITYNTYSKEKVEYPEDLNYNGFTGWANESDLITTFYQTQSASFTDEPENVPWRGWNRYDGDTKIIQEMRWLAFKNRIFDSDDPYSDAQYLAIVKVSTEGLDSSSAGQVNDRVDFTEYSEWFLLKFEEYRNIARVDTEEYGNEDVLFGSSETYDGGFGLGPEAVTALGLFDGDPSTKTTLRTLSNTLPIGFWRMFGTVSGTIATISGAPVLTGDITDITDGELPTFEDSEVVVEEVVFLPEDETIERIEVELAQGSPNVPKDLEIQVISGSDPTQDSSWVTVRSLTNVVERFVTVLNDSSGEFPNDIDTYEVGGKFLREDFSPPLVASGVRIKITGVEEFNSNYPGTMFEEFRIYQTISGSSDEQLIIENDPAVFAGGRRSLKITYKAGGSESRVMTSPFSFNLMPDPKWMNQDFLSLYVKVSDEFAIEKDTSYIRLGESREEYYEWNFSQLGDLDDVLSKKLLRFKDATAKGGSRERFESTGQLEDFEPGTNFREGPLEFFEVEINPIGTASSDFSIWFDNFSIERENFTLPSRYNDTLYLNNGELVYFPLAGFDIRKGFISMIITPDWNKTGEIENSPYGPGSKVYTIFSAVNGNNDYMSCYYSSRDGEGLVVTIVTSTVKLVMVTGPLLTLEAGKPFTLGLAWDNEGTRLDARLGATVRLYLDDEVIGDWMQTWEIAKTPDTYFFLGSRSYLQAATSIEEYFREFGFPVQFRPKVNSVSGGLENLLISVEPRQVKYEDVRFLKDHIFVSLDGINFYSGSSTQLPLTANNIANGDEIVIYLKTNFPEDITNMEREGFLKARWVKR